MIVTNKNTGENVTGLFIRFIKGKISESEFKKLAKIKEKNNLKG